MSRPAPFPGNRREWRHLSPPAGLPPALTHFRPAHPLALAAGSQGRQNSPISSPPVPTKRRSKILLRPRRAQNPNPNATHPHSFLSLIMRPIIKAINTPAEVLFTRQADTSHRLEYAHVAFPLNISFVEQAVFNLEAAHRRWHKKTIYNSLPNNPADALHHLPHNEGDSTWSRQSKYAATRLIRAKEHANRQRHLFSSIDSNIEEYTRAHPHEAHDFIVNCRPEPPGPRSSNYFAPSPHTTPADSFPVASPSSSAGSSRCSASVH